MWIELEGVRAGRRGGASRAAPLEGVSFGRARGESVAFLGPAGAGKSTLLHVLGCLRRPDAGCLRFDGVRVDRRSDAELARPRGRRIGLVFAGASLGPE